MRRIFACAVAGLAAALLVSLAAAAQGTNSQADREAEAWKIWKFHPMERAVGDGGPAPKRDLTGTWAGPSSGMAVPPTNARNPKAPPMTPLGQRLFAMNKPMTGNTSPANTNDPHVRYCDPYGFPQNMTNEIRGLQVATMPNKVVFLFQYMDLWREVWTDGRALPPNVGGTGRYTLSPKYNGYSVGHWEDDYTFVVETTGLDERTWTVETGYPHSVDAHVTERYTRLSRNDMKVEITMVDPKIYTAPFVIGTVLFRWVPNQQLDDFTCIPSEVQEYLKTMGDPAGSDSNAGR
jgi:hypothetical protein